MSDLDLVFKCYGTECKECTCRKRCSQFVKKYDVYPEDIYMLARNQLSLNPDGYELTAKVICTMVEGRVR